MKKVILFGGTGRLGKKVAGALQQKKYITTAVVGSSLKAAEIKPYVHHTIIAAAADRSQMKGICRGFDIVVSALGKSVSLNDRSKPGFMDVDLAVNAYVLEEALAASVKKFVYVSAFGSENNQQLNYFKAHHLFSEKLMASGIDYSIIKPPAIFSSFIDLVTMVRAGRLFSIGKGDKRTNPIYEGDLAGICVDSILLNNKVIEAGGKTIYTRRQINGLIQQHADPRKKVKTMPLTFVKCSLPLMKWADKNSFDKFSFFLKVMERDLVAPQLGNTTLETYLSEKLYQ